MVRVNGLLPRGVVPVPVTAAPRDELGMHDMALAVDVRGIESGGYEELGEPVERILEVGGLDVEEVPGVREGRGGVGGAAVLGDEPPVLVGIGVFLGTQKQDVLEKVCESRTVVGIARVPYVHVESGRGLVGIRVGDHKRLHPVVERERAVVPRVGGAALDLGAGYRSGDRQQQDERRRQRPIQAGSGNEGAE